MAGWWSPRAARTWTRARRPSLRRRRRSRPRSRPWAWPASPRPRRRWSGGARPRASCSAARPRSRRSCRQPPCRRSRHWRSVWPIATPSVRSWTRAWMRSAETPDAAALERLAEESSSVLDRARQDLEAARQAVDRRPAPAGCGRGRGRWHPRRAVGGSHACRGAAGSPCGRAGRTERRGVGCSACRRQSGQPRRRADA